MVRAAGRQAAVRPVALPLSPDQAAFLTGHSFFPSLVTQPFADSPHVAFWFAIVASLVAAAASWFGRPRGGEAGVADEPARVAAPAS